MAKEKQVGKWTAGCQNLVQDSSSQPSYQQQTVDWLKEAQAEAPLK